MVLSVAIGQGQRIGERRRVRVRGGVRPISRPRAIDFKPIVEQPPPATDLQCPELEGLQLYPDPASCNGFYQVYKIISYSNFFHVTLSLPNTYASVCEAIM